MAKEELFENVFMKTLFKDLLYGFPVKRGKVDIQAIKTAMKILKEKKVLAIFPEGTRGNGKELLPGKTGIALIALKTRVPVVPIGIAGPYRLFRRIHVNIGAAVDLSPYYGKKITQDLLEEVTDLIMQNISKLSGIPMKRNF
jgi:1-acyl-sn-glycerol-3-phosphate acyltransferase